ncbi:hypothetical protein JRQ81_008460 [Phrynocephalus forsythii]|uniref:Uncharacterized protein n=1 Tax=Phrynocephalus forsythii TaxID=171643 RepID=A0A9Q0Y7J4_9SAUR|nr:hypothetical protein JRQ81_008460 [Phrynocephalus forsythii]
MQLKKCFSLEILTENQETRRYKGQKQKLRSTSSKPKGTRPPLLCLPLQYTEQYKHCK